jgi:uncharacterized protein
MSDPDFEHEIGEDAIPRRIPPLPDMTLADIPPQVGLFPLPGALLLPWGKLPLNVFEPRYVAMLEDALASHRLIGMIQPIDEDEVQFPALADDPAPALHDIGCLGRITSFTERADSTFAVTLSGLARFRVLRELPPTRGYRQARIDTSAFVGDLVENTAAPLDRAYLMESLKRYFRAHSLRTSWSTLEQMEDDALLVVLPMLVPFTTDEKQSLLEARSLEARADLLLALLNEAPEGGASDDPDDE